MSSPAGLPIAKHPASTMSTSYAVPLQLPSLAKLSGTLFLACLAYIIYVAVHRVYFHPLSRVPGPKLAALSRWYEFYFDIFVWPGGQYIHEVERMHQKYGPIVRVSPDEIHVKDSEFFDTLFCSTAKGQKRDKYPPAAHLTGTPYGTFGTVEHDVHRRRRAAVSNFFSQKAVDSLVPFIHDKVDLLFNNIDTQLNRDTQVDVRPNFLAFSTDLICALSFHRDYLGLLYSEERAKKWQSTIMSLAFLVPIVKQFPWLIPAALSLGPKFWNGVIPVLGRVVSLQYDMKVTSRVEIDMFEKSSKDKVPLPSGFEDSKEPQLTETNRANLFQTILSSTVLSKEDKSVKRLSQEAAVFLAAGGETCARALSVGLFHILANKERVLPPLLAELQAADATADSRMDVSQLSKLPYLTAVIKEVLRITAFVTGRLGMSSPNEVIQYKDYAFEPGTAISMTLKDIQYDPEIFKEPYKFMPERWLPSNPDYEIVNRFHVSFSRGSRACMGISLAYAQLYIVFSRILLRFNLDLYETTFERDVEGIRDCFIGEPSFQSKGIRVQRCA